MYRQKRQLFLFLNKNKIPPPPLPLITSIELLNNRITIAHYLPTDFKCLSSTTNTQVDVTPTTTQQKNHKHQTEDTTSQEQSPLTTANDTTDGIDDTTPRTNNLTQSQKVQVCMLHSKIDNLQNYITTLTSSHQALISKFCSKFFPIFTTNLVEHSKSTSSPLFHLHDLLPILESINMESLT